MFSLFVPVNASAHHGANTNPELYLAENLIELDGKVCRASRASCVPNNL
jgi:hypothetical protein